MEKSKDFLLEIGTEEFPATYIKPALSEMQKLMEEKLKERGIDYSKLVVYATPRRLVLIIEEINCKGKEGLLEINGPPKKRAFDQDNVPTGVAIGFAKKYGVGIEDLLVKKTQKGEYICIKKKQPPEDTKKALAEIVPQIITSLNFPRTMRWITGSDFHFARPIRLLLCLYGNKTVKFTFQNIKSGNYTYGLYALSRQKVVIPLVGKYKEILRNNCVIVDMEERKKIINKAIAQVVRKTGGTILEDNKLVEEINFLLEYPTAILGKFPEKYLDLPKEVLITCMRHHQKYFCIVDKEEKLLPFFVALRNGTSEYLEVLREGLEKVLVARLQDAEFYFKQDTKTPLVKKVEKLKKVVYHQQLGSLYNKVERVIKISEFIAREVEGLNFNLSTVKRIALLSKADLVTEMVKEFPELEGVMGEIYALHCGEEEIVSKGIREHYLPQSLESVLPKTVESLIVSIADKMDTIAGNFCVGLIPSGSGDPYALKKCAQGIIRIMIDKGWRLSLGKLVNSSVGLFNLEEEKQKLLKQQILQFFYQRMENTFTSFQLSYDEIDAVLSVKFVDIADSFKRVCTLHRFRHLPDFIQLITLFKRAYNIVKQAEREGRVKKDDGCSREFVIAEVNIELLQEPAEKELWEIFNRKVKGQTEKLLKESKYEEGLKVLLSLQEYINNFFDSVKIMAEKEDLRNNRLTLLRNIVELFLRIADFSKIVIEGKKEFKNN